MARPVMRVSSATAHLEQELTGVVTVGPLTAARLSKVLKREVLPGEQFDLGTLAYYHPNPIKRVVRSFFRIKRNPFN